MDGSGLAPLDIQNNQIPPIAVTNDLPYAEFHLSL